jgi:hypothetical protein
MNMKTVVILAVLLVALLGIWFWLGQRESDLQSGRVPEQVIQVDSNSVDRMSLERHNMVTLVFEKDFDGYWNIVEPIKDRASENMVNQMERALVKIQLQDMVSSRESQHSIFQISDVQATRLRAWVGDELKADILIGKLADDRQHVYVREAGSNTVYTATGGGPLAALSRRTIDTFRSRSIFDNDKSVYDSVYVQGSQKPYTVVRADTSSWDVRVSSDAVRPADPAPTEAMMQALGHIRATGFADDSLQLDWTNPGLSIRAWHLDGTEDNFSLQKVKDENNYWLMVEGRPHFYKVYESVFKTFDRDPALLAKKDGPS